MDGTILALAAAAALTVARPGSAAKHDETQLDQMRSAAKRARKPERRAELENEVAEEEARLRGVLPLPLPEDAGEIRDVRYRMANNDWHALTSRGWWYLRTDIPKPLWKWVASLYGPTS